MTDKEMQELALFKFSLIAPIVNNTFVAASQIQYLRDVASKTHTLPNGKQVKYSSDTIKNGLLVTGKKDLILLSPKHVLMLVYQGLLTIMPSKIHDIKDKYPYITGKLLYQQLIEEGYIKESNTSMSSVLRYLRDNNLKRSQLQPVERKAYEMEFANDCWQADTSHGPVIKVNGLKRQTYLIIILDDASRIICHGEFFFNDNAVNMQTVFKKAISKYGLPKRLFVDNGPSYKNDQLRMICASLGVVLIFTKSYSPQSKGKVERAFRTIKDNWINGVDWNVFDSLESLNSAFNAYLNEKYMNQVHSSSSITPRERYIQDSCKIKYIKPEDLDGSSTLVRLLKQLKAFK